MSVITYKVKTCPECGHDKPLRFFYSQKPDAPCGACVLGTRRDEPGHRPARRRLEPHAKGDKNVAARYGLTVEQYRELRDIQGNRCAVCRASPPARQRLHLDHDHSMPLPAGVRGFLCSRCNSLAGSCGDSPETARERGLYALARYIEGPRPWAVIPGQGVCVQLTLF